MIRISEVRTLQIFFVQVVNNSTKSASQLNYIRAASIWADAFKVFNAVLNGLHDWLPEKDIPSIPSHSLGRISWLATNYKTLVKLVNINPLEEAISLVNEINTKYKWNK